MRIFEEFDQIWANSSAARFSSGRMSGRHKSTRPGQTQNGHHRAKQAGHTRERTSAKGSAGAGTWWQDEWIAVTGNVRSPLLKPQKQEDCLKGFRRMCFRHDAAGDKVTVCEKIRTLEIDVPSWRNGDPGICTAKDVELGCDDNKHHAVIHNVPVIDQNLRHFHASVWLADVRVEWADAPHVTKRTSNIPLEEAARIAMHNSNVLGFGGSQARTTESRRLQVTGHREHELGSSSTRRRDRSDLSSTDHSDSFGEQPNQKRQQTSKSAVPQRSSTSVDRPRASDGMRSSNELPSQPEVGNDHLLETSESAGGAEQAASSNAGQETPSDPTNTHTARSSGDAKQAASSDAGQERPLNPTNTHTAQSSGDAQQAASSNADREPSNPTDTRTAQSSGDAKQAASSNADQEQPSDPTVTQLAQSPGNVEDPSVLNGAHSNLLSKHSMQPPSSTDNGC